MKKKTIFITVAVIAVVAAIVTAVTIAPQKSGAYDQFAQCIKDSGTTFYGAFWCPHCRDQKAEFGKSAKYLPYVECSTSDGQSQNATCNAAGIQGYPTWVFPDHSTTTGVQTLQTLAEKTSCPLPSAQ
ncbi:MAG TPA: thioredoxin domain-containing protein [Candidatus Paceibacterota bacterium]|nr:thioredoxin domain-containing protein [Candidatus Paceibacterota bacterium]